MLRSTYELSSDDSKAIGRYPLTSTLSVVVPVHEGTQVVAACLDGLRNQTRTATEVIVVDDASTDGSSEWLAACFPEVRIRTLERNRGFPATCNRGLEWASGDIVAFLNQDAVPDPGWVAAIHAAFATSPRIGIVGGLGYDAQGELCHAGGTIDARGQALHDRGWLGEGLWDVDFTTGASLALSRAAIETSGGFDERFCPGYYEDVDLCYRVRRAGLRVVVASDVQFVHLEHSRLADSAGFARHFHRNRMLFALAQLHGWESDDFLAAELDCLGELRGTDHPLIEALGDLWLDLSDVESGSERRSS